MRGRRPDAAELILRRGQPMLLRGGSRLYSAGDPSDAIYLLLSGRVRVWLPADGELQPLRELGPGDLLGAVGVYSGRPRSTTAVAVRDSRLLRMDAKTFSSVLKRKPDALWAFGQMCLDNLVARNARDVARGQRSNVRTIALIPGRDELPLEPVAAGLEKALAAFGRCCRVDEIRLDAALGAGTHATAVAAESAHLRVVEYLTRLEQDHDFVIYQAATPRDTPWSRRCLRQADKVLVATQAEQQARTPEILAVRESDFALAGVEMLYLQPADMQGKLYPWTWRERCAAEFHYWVRPESSDSVARLARLLTGRATALVLGGGGARGAAHLGLLQAMQERGLWPDIIGGTSIGAIIGAMVAMDMDQAALRAALQHLFIDNNHLNDYVVPRVALLRGNKMRTAMEDVFGAQRIECLPRPFFCVSTNLTKARSEIHWRGPVVQWCGASSSVPGIVPPVPCQGDWLVDGAILNNMPVNVMQALGRGWVIGSDVNAAEQMQLSEEGEAGRTRQGRQQNLFKILFRAATLLSPEQRASRRAAADLYLDLPVMDVGMFDWSGAQRLIDEACAFAGPRLDQWLDSRS